ncbi:uncharacterized protein SPSK_05733 [Sporothrix schenckii 1099-18]|uniref:Uncharacterized protein n=1 Tax=Sporothrix schenckii 1099-18 TaxID=1397361 RepID=A0A0F2LTQ5_SPOSC|nr:uncharacterized protein SPSK_05733 [Sporothrix schenckii 1099-18]KJR80858.1 hypothetical protein SPSK_05733 [Sporothrix schenckii 1099-18]
MAVKVMAVKLNVDRHVRIQGAGSHNHITQWGDLTKTYNIAYPGRIRRWPTVRKPPVGGGVSLPLEDKQQSNYLVQPQGATDIVARRDRHRDERQAS